MGGEPLIALNVVCFPTSCEPISVLQEILDGGAHKIIEANAMLAGGHSVQDEEPKYGLVVFGEVDAKAMWTVGTAREGDCLLLTKPVGTGIAVTAIKAGLFAPDVKLYCGFEGLMEISVLPECDMLVAAVVGTQALKPTLAAISAGKDIALANKELLVMAGKFVMGSAREKGVQILPLDSEHNAIFQCLCRERKSDVAKLLITASGGIKSVDDIKKLRDMGMYGAICGKSLYSGTLTLSQALEAAGE